MTASPIATVAQVRKNIELKAISKNSTTMPATSIHRLAGIKYLPSSNMPITVAWSSTPNVNRNPDWAVLKAVRNVSPRSSNPEPTKTILSCNTAAGRFANSLAVTTGNVGEASLSRDGGP